MNVEFTNAQDALSVSPKEIEHLVETFLNWKGVSCDQVNIHFVDKEEISRIHKEFFDDPSPTDCISFPIDLAKDPSNGYTILGEVFVCPEIGIEYAKHAQTHSPQEEVSLYIIHGLLHLLGFDDLSKEQRVVMRGEENSAMGYLKEKKALLS